MKRLLAALAIAAFVPAAQAQWGYGRSDDRDGVTAMGEAEVRVVPDIVEIALGVESHDVELQKAREMNDAAINRIIDTAKRHGIDARHIKTDYVSIEPSYEYPYNARNPQTYIVRKSLVITSTDIGTFEALLPDLIKAGANHVHRVQFMTSELRKHRDEARVLASKAAREKAELLAKNQGRTLGPARAITEYSGDDWWSSYGSWWGWNRSQSQNAVQNVGGEGVTMNGIAPGQISVRARVSVTYELQ